jgi:hypothetical protein
LSAPRMRRHVCPAASISLKAMPRNVLHDRLRISANVTADSG